VFKKVAAVPGLKEIGRLVRKGAERGRDQRVHSRPRERNQLAQRIDECFCAPGNLDAKHDVKRRVWETNEGNLTDDLNAAQILGPAAAMRSPLRVHRTSRWPATRDRDARTAACIVTNLPQVEVAAIQAERRSAFGLAIDLDFTRSGAELGRPGRKTNSKTRISR